MCCVFHNSLVYYAGTFEIEVHTAYKWLLRGRYICICCLCLTVIMGSIEYDVTQNNEQLEHLLSILRRGILSRK